ncbi:MAG: HAD hydrolase family protein, partial [Lachnospiraceae bacterium]|nr:HAD hydrolase family protein [Lachnospiraceae bacterium]
MIQLNDIAKMTDELAKVKLLALDLDGTVLTDEKHVTERMAAALHAAVSAELITVYVTGRPLTGIPDELMAIPHIRYAITSNGAVTTDLQSGERLRG